MRDHSLFIKHQTKREELIRFFLILATLFLYFIYLWFKHDFTTGGLLSALTWSFFVLCTPIADGGFLIDFPIRLFFGIRMVISEIIVWVIAISINIFCLIYMPQIYKHTVLTSIFYQILTNPWPYWGIILISGLGTFISIIFCDEMIDVISHNKRVLFHKHGFVHSIIKTVGILILILTMYYYMLNSLNINIPK